MSKYKYINSRGNPDDVIDLCNSPLWVASFNSLRSYSYEPVEQNGVFYGFKRRKNVEKPLTFQYHGAGREAFLAFREQFYRVINHDVVSGTYGRLYDGEYYAVGNFPKETVTTYDKIRRLWISEVPFFMPEEVWYREIGSFIFETGTVTESDEEGADFPTDYPRYLASGNVENTLHNDSAFPSPFRLTVFGPCENPTVTIAGHIYNVGVTVPSGSRLIVDSTQKTAKLVNAANTETNVFGYQNHDANKYLFEPIPSGAFNVTFPSTIPRVILTLFEERSAAKWS